MGKKNIQPTTSSPVSRTLVVAPRPALEELRAEPQEGHISSLTGPDPSDRDPGTTGEGGQGGGSTGRKNTSYDGDDE